MNKDYMFSLKLGNITKRGDLDSSYCRWYSKAE